MKQKGIVSNLPGYSKIISQSKNEVNKLFSDTGDLIPLETSSSSLFKVNNFRCMKASARTLKQNMNDHTIGMCI